MRESLIDNGFLLIVGDKLKSAANKISKFLAYLSLCIIKCCKNWDKSMKPLTKNWQFFIFAFICSWEDLFVVIVCEIYPPSDYQNSLEMEKVRKNDCSSCHLSRHDFLSLVVEELAKATRSEKPLDIIFPS